MIIILNNIFITCTTCIKNFIIFGDNSFYFLISAEPVLIKVPVQEEGPGDPSGDDLYMYSVGLLIIAMDFLVFQYTIKSGDIDTMTILLKRLIPLFIDLASYRSKYAIEYINILTADMQQENSIKMVKKCYQWSWCRQNRQSNGTLIKSSPCCQ